MKTRKNKSINFFKLGILFFGMSLLLWNCEKDENINLNNSQNEFSIPSIIQTKKLFLQKTFSKKIHSKSKNNLEILWEKSIPKEFKENINILYTPVSFNSSIRFKSLIASVKKENQIQSYILTLVYDKISNNQQFSGHIFKHDSKGDFIEVYQYQNGNYIQTLKELNTSNKYANRGCSCSTSILDVVELIIAGWDVGTLLNCVCVGGTTGGGSSTFNDWSTPSSNIKNPVGWTLGSNDNLGGGSGGTFGDSNNDGDSNNNNGEELNLDGVEPWWLEDDNIINKLPEKAKCVFNKLKGLNLFKATIKKFENSKNYNLILEEGNNCGNAIAEAYTDASDLANGNITITFQSLGNNNLSFAASLLHEGIHAEIYKYVDEHKKGIDPNDRPNVLYYYNQFKAKNALDEGTTFAQHEHMQDNYVIPLAEAIRKLDGNRHPLKEYLGFGWDGLKVYKYDKYIDANGNIQTMPSADREKLNEKSDLIAASSSFAADCK